MNMTAYVMAFLMGLAGSLHCAGMCGPIVLIMPFHMLSGMNKWIGLFLYHFGRISIYAVFGLLLHSFKAFFRPQIQQHISVALGLFLLLAGLFSFLPIHRMRFTLPWIGFVKNKFGSFVSKPGLLSLMVAGMLNGLLPCGLVYIALSASVTAHSAFQSMLLMYAFGAGTIPALMTLVLLQGKLRFIRQPGVKKATPVIIVVFGCLFMIRGLNLGIPYLSPKITIVQSGIKANCCHKK